MDNFANVPASVAVAFPRSDEGSVNDSVRMNAGIRVEQHYVLSIAGTGHAGHQLLHSTALANFSGDGLPDNYDELAALAAQIAADWYAWRLASIEIRYESVVAWPADGMHDLEWIHGADLTTAVHRSEWEPEFGELKHAGSYGSSDEPAIAGTQAVKIVDGELVNGKFDGLLQIRTGGAETDDAPVWVIDWAGATELPADELHNGTWRGIEAGGPYLISVIDDNQGLALTNTSAWLPVVGSLTPSAWTTGTYPAGTLKSHSSSTWVAKVETADEPGASDDWRVVELGDAGGYRAQNSYAAGEYVQELRPLYAIRSSNGGGDDSCCGCQVATASWRHGTNTEGSPSSLHLQADPPASRSVDSVVEVSGPGMVDLTPDNPQTYPYEFEFTIPAGATDPLTIEIWSHGGDGYYGEFGLGVWDNDEVTTFETFNNFGGGAGTYRKLVIEEPVPGEVYLIRMYYNDVRGTQVLKDDAVILQAPAGNDGNPDLAYTTAGRGGQEASGIGGTGYSGGNTSPDAPHTNFIIADETGEYHDVSAQDAHDMGAVMGVSAGTAGGSGGGVPGPNGAGQDGTRKIIPGSGFEALFPFGAVESFLGGLGYRKGGNGAVFDRGNITDAQDGASPGGGGGGSGLFLEADDTYQSNGYPVGIGGAAKVRISWLPCQEDVLDIVADNLALNVTPIGGGVYQVMFAGPVPTGYGGSGADLSAYPAGVVIKSDTDEPLSVTPTVPTNMGGLGLDASGATTGQVAVATGSGGFTMGSLNSVAGTLSASKGGLGIDSSAAAFNAVPVAQGGGSFAMTGGEKLIRYEAENKEGSSISAGMACAVHSSGVGVVKASAADGTKIAVGLIQATTANTFSGQIQSDGLFTMANWTAVTGTATLAAKATYFLDPTTPGMLTATPPTTPGQIVQVVGTAVSTTTLDLTMETPILL